MTNELKEASVRCLFSSETFAETSQRLSHLDYVLENLEFSGSEGGRLGAGAMVR